MSKSFRLSAIVFVVLMTETAHAQFSSVVNVPPTPAPMSIDAGTQLNLLGGSLGKFFRTNGASELNVFDGVVGDFLQAGTGSTINVFNGTIKDFFEASFNSVVNISGGAVGGSFRARPGSQVNILGGSIYGDFNVEGSVKVANGILTAFKILNGGAMEVRGGSMGFWVTTNPGSTLKLIGSEFKLDGAAVPGLSQIGDHLPFNLTANTALTGVLADGTPFVLSPMDGDQLAAGTLQLETSIVPSAAPTTFVAGSGALPRGLRQGQTLVVDDGGKVQNHFCAAPGSRVEVGPGGWMGYDLEAVGATVNLSGGVIDFGMNAFDGTIINVYGGEVASEFAAFKGSTVNIYGGRVDQFFTAWKGSTVNIFGGAVDRFFDAGDGSVVNIAGGTIGVDFDAFSGSKINFLGTSFFLNGIPIGGLSIGTPFAIAQRDVTLSGQYADGMPFSFRLNSLFEGNQTANSFDPNALITVTLVPEPTSALLVFIVCFAGSVLPAARERREFR